jgi:G:T-mismatch repair DNA endonuclease (very short patch repair protein)
MPEKVQRNQQFGAGNDRRLRDAGWRLDVVWEHEDPIEGSQSIAAIVVWYRQRHAVP